MRLARSARGLQSSLILPFHFCALNGGFHIVPRTTVGICKPGKRGLARLVSQIWFVYIFVRHLLFSRVCVYIYTEMKLIYSVYDERYYIIHQANNRIYSTTVLEDKKTEFKLKGKEKSVGA